MDRAAGEADRAALRVAFDHRLKLEFHGSKVTSDAGLLSFRDLDDALGLTDLAGEGLTDSRTGQNSRHTLIAQLRQSVFGRLAGYEDVNDADRLAHDPALRWIVGGRAVAQSAASTQRGLPTACQAPEGWLRPRCALASWNEGMAPFSNCGRALAYGPAGAPWSGSNRV